jgi:hypothetical protein
VPANIAYLRALSSSLFHAVPLLLSAGDSFLFHISAGLRMTHQQGSWYSTCGLFSLCDDSNRTAICFVYMIKQIKLRALPRNAFLPSWLAISQSVESLNFTQREANYSLCCLLHNMQLHLQSILPRS